MKDANQIAAAVGHVPVAAANSSIFSALRTGATSAIYAEATKRKAKASYIASFVELGFSEDEAERMYAGE